MKAGDKTKEKLLHAAAELFAQKGYHETTVTDISRKAGVNIAAVNYHFKDKEGLYAASWDYTHELYRSQASLIPADDTDMEPGDCLRHFVKNALKISMDDGEHNWFDRLMLREMHRPTSFLPHIFQNEIIPRINYITHIIEGISDTKFSELDMSFLRYTLVSLCFMPLFHSKFRERFDALGTKYDMPEEMVKRICRLFELAVRDFSARAEEGSV